MNFLFLKRIRYLIYKVIKLNEHLKELKNERRILNKKLEEKIAFADSYEEKFLIIYKIIRKS